MDPSETYVRMTMKPIERDSNLYDSDEEERYLDALNDEEKQRYKE